MAALAVFAYAVASSVVLGSAQDGAGAGGGTDPTIRSIWDGVFTGAQAERGRTFYLASCAECHGADLRGGEYSAIAGDRFWASWQDRTVGELLTQISENMPFSDDGSRKGTLGASTYADIVAHILKVNTFPVGTSNLTEQSIAEVTIAREEGPGELPSGSFAHVVGCLARGQGRNWRLIRGSAPARVTAGNEPDVTLPLGNREYNLMFVITSLDTFVGHRMSVRATLMGEGGTGGLNVGAIRSVAETCE